MHCKIYIIHTHFSAKAGKDCNSKVNLTFFRSLTSKLIKANSYTLLFKKVRNINLEKTGFILSKERKVFYGILFQFRETSRKSKMENQMCQLWNPSEIFASLDGNHAIVVLNRPIICEENVIKNIWKTGKFILCYF